MDGRGRARGRYKRTGTGEEEDVGRNIRQPEEQDAGKSNLGVCNIHIFSLPYRCLCNDYQRNLSKQTLEFVGSSIICEISFLRICFSESHDDYSLCLDAKFC
jgi:hypothetical protein